MDSSPNLVGGVPFCYSGSLGTILCYPPNFLKKAYDFPATTGRHALDGTGQNIFIIDAFGYPTSLLQSDLNTYDQTFGVPATTVTVLCGPTWTGAGTDACPLNTLNDITTVGNTPGGLLCGGPNGVQGWMGETMLDVTMAHSLAPGAHIFLVVANDCLDTSLYGAEMAVVTQHQYRGGIMSQSFGAPDDLETCTALDPTNSYCVSWDPSLLYNCQAGNIGCPDVVFTIAALNQWTVMASTGDEGANEDALFLGTAELTPSFPSTSPLVLAVGGTQGSPYGGTYGGPPGSGGTFSCAAGAICNTGLVVVNGGINGCGTATRPAEPTSCYPIGYGGEGTWNEFTTFGSLTYESGGGFSMLYNIPWYQWGVSHTYTTLQGNQVKATGRMTPDVSFNSAVYGGVMTCEHNLSYPTACHWYVNGGTSAASPAWAGIMALANQANGRPLGFVNPAIYSIGHSKSFHDITLGNNAACSGYCGEDGYVAGKGYDMATGWGTPDVSHLISALTQNSQ